MHLNLNYLNHPVGEGITLKNKVWKIESKFLHLQVHVHIIKPVKIVRHDTNCSPECLAKAA